MNRIISAVYEHGRIYPLEPLNINENQRLKVQIVPEILSDQSEHVVQFLIQTGLLTPPAGHSQMKSVPEEERSRLAAILAKAASKPLSEMIIEERGQ
jgi:predicted DNA-binding antitoxin AbrB/MazE fold protein